MKKLYCKKCDNLEKSLKTIREVSCLGNILDIENKNMMTPEYTVNYYWRIRTEYVGDKSQELGKEWKKSYSVILSAEHMDFCTGFCNFEYGTIKENMKIKGFDKDLCCRGMQYEVGKEYTTNGKNLTIDDLCSDQVLHYCDSIQNASFYYDCREPENRYCEIEVLGEEVTDGVKYGSNHIKILREIKGEELEVLKGHIYGNTGLFNNGKFNTGDHNKGYQNNGDCNCGNFNEGFANYGNGNAGRRNFGNGNNGSYNRGHYNKGNCNNGDYNSGDCNCGDYHNGVFCNEKQEDTVMFFNKKSNITWSQWQDSPVYCIISSLGMIRWKDWAYMPIEEKRLHPDAYINGGYLKKCTYKEAWVDLWKHLTDDEKDLFKNLPNFDPEIFEDITGIKI